MRKLFSILFLLFSVASFAQVKIPVTSNYVYQDNSQQDRADILVDGSSSVNYTPSGPMLYPSHEIVFDLTKFYATVTSVKMFVTGTASSSVHVIVVKFSDNTETDIGTFSGGTNTSFTYSAVGGYRVSKVILRQTSTTAYACYGSEVEIYGTYTTPTTPTAKSKRPLGWMAGANGHSWDLMNDSKISAIKSLGITNGSLRIYDYPYQTTNAAGAWTFEGELGTDRYSTDSAFGIMHRWSDSVFTWKALSGQYTDQQITWDVIDDFPNKYIRGTVVTYNDFGGWGQVTLNVTAVAGATEQTNSYWYVYKSGVLVNKTITAEAFSSTLVGQNRVYNVGGGLGFVAGNVLTFYKSQSSVNPINFAYNTIPQRNSNIGHLRAAKGLYVYAERGGTVSALPNYTVTSGQRMLKGARLYNMVEPSNEPDAWWSSLDGFWNGKTMFYHWNMAYDGNKGEYADSLAGAKNADPDILVTTSGMATDKVDQLQAAIEQARLVRGYNVDSTINVPFNVVSAHIYPSAEGQFGFGNTGGLPPEQGMFPQLRNYVWLLEHYTPNVQLFISEWGYDQNVNSPLRAGQFGSYSRETVGGFWMVRAMLGMAAIGVDRSQYYRLFQDWPEDNSNTNGTQFATMRLLSQPLTDDPTLIVRSMQGNYMAQYNEFKNYHFLDTVATGITGVYEYRYTNGTNTLTAIWSEEVTSIVGGAAVFTERTGTVSLSAGSYTLRRFLDDGSIVMSSQAFSGGSVTYGSKPVFIINAAPTPPTQRKTGITYF